MQTLEIPKPGAEEGIRPRKYLFYCEVGSETFLQERRKKLLAGERHGDALDTCKYATERLNCCVLHGGYVVLGCSYSRLSLEP